MEFMGVYLSGLALVAASMTLLWLLSLPLRNSSIADIFWGPGFALVSWCYFVLGTKPAPRLLLLCLLVSLWGARLAVYILLRNWGKGEDYRYRQWRSAAGGQWWWKSLFKVFWLQGLLIWMISAPLAAAGAAPAGTTLNLVDVAGVLLWAAGFFCEAIADWQMARFKANPANRGRLMDRGLWRYSRHPNYFGDAVQWWGLFMVSSAGGGAWTVFSPILMTYLLLRVSGVTLLESTLTQQKPGYEDYRRRTSTFFPWRPRKT